MATPRGTPTACPVAEGLTSLISGIEAARRSAVLYPDSHPRFQASVASLGETVNRLASGRPLKLTVYRQECFLNGEAPERPVEVPPGFSERFLRLGLASVILPPDVTREELTGLLRLLAADLRQLGRARSVADMAKEYGTGRITLEALDYGRLFAAGLGRPAEAGRADEGHIARLLTLYDPTTGTCPLSQEDLEALERLAVDRAGLARLMELGLTGQPDGASALTEGSPTMLLDLAQRLKGLYPERWDVVKKTFIKAALTLDPEVALRRRSDLLARPAQRPRTRTPADEMSDGELAALVAEALCEKPYLDDGVAAVLRDLVPDEERRVALQPLIASKLALAGVGELRRKEILAWWEERVVRGEGFVDEADPLFSLLMADTGPVEEIGEPWAPFLEQDSISASYLDDLRGLLATSTTPAEVEEVLPHYHEELLRMAREGKAEELWRLAQELAGELGRCGYAPQDAMAHLLSVSLLEALASLARSPDPAVRRASVSTARLFGQAGSRVLVRALAEATDWDVSEDLRQAILTYGSQAEEELVQWLSHTDPRVVREVLRLLRRIGSENAARKVEVLLGHRDPDVRISALAAMVRIGGERRVAAVEQCMRDPSPRVVQAALDAALELGIERFVTSLGTLIRSHRDEEDFVPVRRTALELVGKARLVGLRDTVEEVVNAAGSWTTYTTDDKLAVTAAKALLQLGDPQARAFVEKKARWSMGASGKACRQALREEAEQR